MKQAFSAIWSAASALVGVAVFLVLMWGIARAHSRRWRLVAERYSAKARAPIIARKLETIVVTRRGRLSPISGTPDYRQYAGAIIAVTEGGLRLSLIPIPPLNVMSPALFLPFEEMELAQTVWALWPDPFALRMTKLPDIDIIVARDAVQWIRSHTISPPFGWDV